MKRGLHSILLAAISILGPFVSPSGVSAGGSVGNGWNSLDAGSWYFGPRGEGGEERATAVFELALSDVRCLNIKVDGSERQFTVSVSSAKEGQTWGELLTCLDVVLEDDPEVPYQLIDAAFWASGDMGEQQLRVYPCLDVTGGERGNETVEAVLALFGLRDEEELENFLQDFEYGDVFGGEFPIGSARFFDVGLVLFGVGLDVPGDSETALSWEFDINIRECGYSGPDIDIEHYRRMAEEASALPDTR